MKSLRGITSEDLFQITWVNDPTPSPQGGQLVYVSRKTNEARDGYSSHLRLLNLENQKDRAFTSGDKDHAPAWSPDGSQLAFLREHEGKIQVWLIASDGGEAQQVSHLKHGVSSLLWSPDGLTLLVKSSVDMSEKDEDETEDIDKKLLKELVVDRIRMKSDSGGLFNGRRTHLFRVPTEGGEAIPVITGHYDVGDYVWSPDGESIAWIAQFPEEGEQHNDYTLTNHVYRAKADGSDVQQLTPEGYSFGRLTYAPDGQSLALLASDRSYGNATLVKLYTLPISGGQPVCLSKDWDVQINHSLVGDMRSHLTNTGPAFSRDGSSILCLATIEGSVRIARFARDGSHAEYILPDEKEFYQFAELENGQIVAGVADVLRPGDLFLYTQPDEVGAVPIQLTHSNPQLDEEIQLSTPETFWFDSSDGLRLQGWMLKPAGMVEGVKVPTILEIHGGPHMMYGFTFMHEFQILAAQGYAVVYINPRGGLGYGQQFVNACRGDYGGGDYRDLMEAMDYAVSRYPFIDESRLGVTGGSYGGFMTNWIVGHTDRFKAAVTQRSISNWLSFYGVSDIGFFFTEDQIGGNAWDDTEKLWKHSPLAYVGNVSTPLLILHGEQDLRCPIEQAEQLYVALKRRKQTTRFVRFPGANHELSRGGHPHLRVRRLEHIAGWFNEHL
ncbi:MULTISPECIES: S9 family peptidase [unclassified Paenibacillus]|uniref:S9 family peptidase n=1 Tax=unclassified Paenibacillus TaxID=185978 RepID=UPI0009A62B5E|nr:MULTISPECIES: S9 family peptidase [unclassified Paenibacillus]SLK02371.1 Dipeptidyl aminopeptidase/acylaminoacyl peptidase [Paenibacillus sp. RU5A]SOC68942.1 Dipeptidyl aminopeptidase/acylaminoacyl peptidase [Paenibacillus sp. RU26A]SOC71388.1 Dipeptidyl aminopeptidase/acylaminoacyl peptidase [Paenibacillus sp. RU5M]